MEFLPKAFPAGVFVVMLGAVTAIWTVLPSDYINPWSRFFLILLVCLLAYGEIRVSYRERDRHEKEMAAIHANARAQFFLTYKMLDTTHAKMDMFNAHLDVVEQLQKVGINQTFKRSALELIQSLIDFFNDWMRKAPPVGFNSLAQPDNPKAREEIRAMIESSLEMAEAYKEKYSAKISVLRDELKARGLTNPELEEIMEQEPNVIGIARIALRLEELVKKIDS